MTTKNKIITGFVVVILLIVGGYYFTHQGTKLALVSGTGEPSGFDNINMTGSLRSGVAAGDINQTTWGNGSISATGQIVSASNVVTDNVNSTTTTATSQVLKGSDIVGYSTVAISLNGGADSITLPSSTTLATFLPNNGDSTTFVLENATSTANTSGNLLTLVAGTGTLLENASSTNATSVLGLSKIATVDVVRKPNSDFIFLFNAGI